MSRSGVTASTDRPSTVRSTAKLLLHWFRRRGKPGRFSERPRVGVAAGGLRTSPGRIERYLKVTDGCRIGAFGPAGLLPPVFPALWETALIPELLRIGDYPFPRRGILHLGGERLYLRPVRPDVVLRLSLEVEQVDLMGGDVRLELRSRLWNAPGQLCTEGKILFLLRAGGTTRAGRRAEVSGEGERGPAWRVVQQWKLGGNHGWRYGRVSGDLNPVHLWGVTARPFGYARPILHGFCIEALATHALIEQLLGGNPAALRRVGIRFVAPLPLPAAASLSVEERPSPGARRFRITVGEAAASGQVAEGEFVGAGGGA